MTHARRAPVKPRVYSTEIGAAVLLEDQVRPLVEEAKPGAIAIVGSPGSGKTTALYHLATVFAEMPNLLFLDDPRSGELRRGMKRRLVLFTGSTFNPKKIAQSYGLAPWSKDDLIEYLLSVHKDRCACVMSRLQPLDLKTLEGNPQVWAVILDALAADPALPDAAAGLRAGLMALCPAPDSLAHLRAASLKLVLERIKNPRKVEVHLTGQGFDPRLARILRHRNVQWFLAAEKIISDLRNGEPCEALKICLPRELIRVAAVELRNEPAVVHYLKTLFSNDPEMQPMTASLLHACDIGWRPESEKPLKLVGAYLDGVSWTGVNSSQSDLSKADLSKGDLQRANLDGVLAAETNLTGANLRGASLRGILGSRINLTRANLTSVNAQRAALEHSNLENAYLEGACLARASFFSSCLKSALFIGADLTNASLKQAEIEDADFSGANLTGVNALQMTLTQAIFTGACFRKAVLRECNLEGMILPEADFEGADLTGAYLTASSMPDANFSNACLKNTGLAEVHWERAFLCNADLRGSSFHLGSSRSGRVNSPIASEGSRTDFYTDDLEEQNFKAPEEIRKANLCGADLRGAKIDNVDFYLVDLRGATYDDEQKRHFQRCGAILFDRAE